MREVEENEHVIKTLIRLKGDRWDETYLHKGSNPIAVVKEIMDNHSDMISWVYIPLWRFKEEERV